MERWARASPWAGIGVCVEILGNHRSETDSLERHDWWKGIGCLSQNGSSLTNWTKATQRSFQGHGAHSSCKHGSNVQAVFHRGGWGSGGSHYLMAPSLQRWSSPHYVGFFFLLLQQFCVDLHISPCREEGPIFSCVMQFLVLKTTKRCLY